MSIDAEFLSYVIPIRAVSNFLIEDFEAVRKFMSAEIQGKKLHL
jgi:hypothetical protein